jgi:signal transduction histidine kinase
MIHSMRMRMTIGFILVMAPLLVVFTHLVLAGLQKAHGDETMVAVKKAMGAGIARLNSPDWKAGLTKLFENQELRRRHIGALVSGASGTVLWKSDSDAPKWPYPPRNTTLLVQEGSLSLWINYQDSSLDAGPDSRGLYIISAAAVLAVGLGSWLLVGRTLSPIRALSRQAAAASADDTETCLVSPSQDHEMRELVSTLNGFLDSIREASAEKARFYAAASHELRTPLHALSGHIEVALAQPRTAEECLVTLQEAFVQTQRLSSLVESILLLHQLQSPVHSVHELVCLSTEIEDQIHSIQPLAEARQLRLSASIEPGVTVQSIPMHVSVLVRNLVENAARHATESGDVAITLAVAGGRPVFRIENQFLPTALDRARLFEPFSRVDTSRSATSCGNGLGLAICRAVVKANQWTLDIDLQPWTLIATVSFSD